MLCWCCYCLYSLPFIADVFDVGLGTGVGGGVQENNENVFVVLDLAPPSAKRIRDLDVSATVTREWDGVRPEFNFQTRVRELR